MNNPTLGSRMKEQRLARGMTQQAIASAIHVNKCTIQRYETDQIQLPKQPVVAAIAQALGVSVAWLMCEVDDKYANLDVSLSVEQDDLAFTYALYEEVGDLTPENKEKLLEMARFFKTQQDK